MNFSKIIIFVFLATASLLTARIFATSSLLSSFIWTIIAGILAFVVIYFPSSAVILFPDQSAPKQKFPKYFKRILILDILLAIIYAIPILVTYIINMNGGESYFALYYSGFVLILIMILVKTQLVIGIIILLINLTARIPALLRYVIFAGIIFVLIFLSFNSHLIPNSTAARDPNAFMEKTNQCDRLTIQNISGRELSDIGCNDFNFFNEDGGVKLTFRLVAPINAFKTCYTQKPSPGGSEGVYTPTNVDCKTHEGQPGVFVTSGNSYHIVPRNFMEKYGFKENDYYFDVCKVILTDYIKEKKQQCSAP